MLSRSRTDSEQDLIVTICIRKRVWLWPRHQQLQHDRVKCSSILTLCTT